MSFPQKDEYTHSLLHELKGEIIAVTHVSPELTMSFQARVEQVLDTSPTEVALLLSQGGRIIANGCNLRKSGNGITLDVGLGKRLYLSRLGE